MILRYKHGPLTLRDVATIIEQIEVSGGRPRWPPLVVHRPDGEHWYFAGDTAKPQKLSLADVEKPTGAPEGGGWGF